MFYRRDQTLLRARCQELLDRVPPPEAANLEEKLLPALLGIKTIARSARLVPGATVGSLIFTLSERLRAGDLDSCRRLIVRALPIRGRISPGVPLAGAFAAAGLLWLLWRCSPGLALLMVLIGAAVAWLLRRVGEQRLALIGRALRSRTRLYAILELTRVRRLLAEYAPESTTHALTAYDRLCRLSRAQETDMVIGWARVRAQEVLANAGASLPDEALLLRAWADARDLIERDQIPATSGNELIRPLLVTAEYLATTEHLPFDLLDSLGTLLVRAPEVGYLYGRVEPRIAAAMKERCAILEQHIAQELQLDEPIDPDVYRALSERCERHLRAPRLRFAHADRERVLEALAENWIRHGDEQQLLLLLGAVDSYADELVAAHEAPGDKFVAAVGLVGKALDRREANSPSAVAAERTLERLWALRHEHHARERAQPPPSGG